MTLYNKLVGHFNQNNPWLTFLRKSRAAAPSSPIAQPTPQGASVRACDVGSFSIDHDPTSAPSTETPGTDHALISLSSKSGRQIEVLEVISVEVHCFAPFLLVTSQLGPIRVALLLYPPPTRPLGLLPDPYLIPRGYLIHTGQKIKKNHYSSAKIQKKSKFLVTRRVIESFHHYCARSSENSL